jgi:MerR family transcriptional regulator, copper efflux regulator
MLIGEVARRTGVPTGTIRFYERHDLIGAAPRSAGGYRMYPERTVQEIGFIKTAQGIGFSLDEIRDVLKLGRGGRMPCSRVVEACQAHLAEIDRRMTELRAFRSRFTRTMRLAQANCGFNPDGFCNAIISG